MKLSFKSVYRLSENDKSELLGEILPKNIRAEDDSEKINLLKATIKELLKDNEQLENKLEQVEKDYAVFSNNYADNMNTIDTLREENNIINNKLEEYAREAERLREVNTILQNELEKYKIAVEEDHNSHTAENEQTASNENNDPGQKTFDENSAQPKAAERSSLKPFVDVEKEVREITDSWEEIISSVNDGSYREKYKIGDYKPLDLGIEGVVRMQIAGFDAEPLADGSGKAAITWIAMDTLKTAHRMNPVYKEGKVGTGALGGWKESEMRRYLEETVKPLIPVSVRNSIKLVKKYSLSAYENIAGYVYDEETEDYLWIPSAMEIDMPDESGDLEVYHADFDVDYSIWLDSCSWLRSVGKIGSFYTSEGRWESAKFNLAVTLCFCT